MPTGTATKRLLLFPHEDQIDTILSILKREAYHPLLYPIVITI